MKMPRIIYVAVVFIGLLMTSCFDDREVLFEGKLIEFDDAVLRAKASGQNFPILPSVGRAVGTPTYKVNLVSSQLTANENVNFSIEAVPTALLNDNTIAAVEGTHYSLNGSSFTIPANTSVVSFGGVNVLADFPAEAGKTALLVVRLDGNETIKPSENFRRIAIRIRLD